MMSNAIKFRKSAGVIAVIVSMLVLSGCASSPAKKNETTVPPVEEKAEPSVKSSAEAAKSSSTSSSSKSAKVSSKKVDSSTKVAKKTAPVTKPKAEKKTTTAKTKTEKKAVSKKQTASSKKTATKPKTAKQSSAKTTASVKEKTVAKKQAVKKTSPKKVESAAKQTTEKAQQKVTKPTAVAKSETITIPASQVIAMAEPAPIPQLVEESTDQSGLNSLDQLPLALGDGWTIDIINTPLSSGKSCLVTNKASQVFDGYENTYVTIAFSGETVWVMSASNFDLTYPDSGFSVLNQSGEPISQLTLEKTVSPTVAETALSWNLLPNQEVGKFVVKTGFWPTWPVTETRIVEFPVANLQNMQSSLKECASLLN